MEDQNWFRTLDPHHELSSRSGGRTVKLYGPEIWGLLCTIEAVAEVGPSRRSVATQLAALNIPAPRAGVQATRLLQGSKPSSVWVHWGDLKIAGDAAVPGIDDLPLQNALASVTAQSYAEMQVREDRWTNIWVGGGLALSGDLRHGWTPPLNVHAQLNPIPGLRLDTWKYAALKKYAQLFGTYYRPAADGLLYRNGVIEQGLGRAATEIFSSADPGITKVW